MAKAKTAYLPVRVTLEMNEQLERLAASSRRDKSAIVREFIEKGLKYDGFKQNQDLLYDTVLQAVKAVIDPSTERLAALNAKTGIMAAAGYFLMVLMLQGNFPEGDVSTLATKARKLAITYLRSKDESVEQLIDSSLQTLIREAEE